MLNPWESYNGGNSGNSISEGDPRGPEDPGGGPDPRREQCPPGYKWVQSAQACKPDVELTQGGWTPSRPDGCPAGQEKSPFNSSGGDAGDNMECVSPEEAQRRFDLRRGQNDSRGGGGSGSSTYKPPAATKSPYDAAMSKTLFDTLTNMINGGDAPFGPDTIARLQAAALQSNKSQLANSRSEIQKRLINSGLSRSGPAPVAFQRLENAAGADLSNNFRSIATNAVQQNYQARVTALNQAQNFLQSERANSLSQDQLVLAYARLNQEWKTTQAQFDQQWKIVQNGNEQEMVKLMLCLRTGVC